jgi:transcriptional regulator with XRE-family HTH domain
MAPDHDVDRVVAAVGGHVGAIVRDGRRSRGWSLRRLATESGLSPSFIQSVEVGHAGSLETYARLAEALGRRLEINLVAPRRVGRLRDEDPIHGAMGEVLSATLRRHGFDVSLDEPYQHYQFAGRGDVVASDLGRAALLHVENRTRLPNFQDAAGSYNAKRRWLAS